jgi:hypothetical protein
MGMEHEDDHKHNIHIIMDYGCEQRQNEVVRCEQTRIIGAQCRWLAVVYLFIM